MAKAKQKNRYSQRSFKLKMNTKHQSNQFFIKTMQAFLISKKRTRAKAKQITLHKLLKNTSSSMDSIYQNTTNKTEPPKKIWTIPLLLESPRSKDF